MKLIKRVFNRTISGRRINNLQLLSFYSISSSDYDKISNETLESLYESLEILGDQVDIPGYDVELANGVLTLKIGSLGTFVINRQPHNKQIWLSSPISGPKRYDYMKGKWIYTTNANTNTIDTDINTTDITDTNNLKDKRQNEMEKEKEKDSLNLLLNRELGQILSRKIDIFNIKM